MGILDTFIVIVAIILILLTIGTSLFKKGEDAYQKLKQTLTFEEVDND